MLRKSRISCLSTLLLTLGLFGCDSEGGPDSEAADLADDVVPADEATFAGAPPIVLDADPTDPDRVETLERSAHEPDFDGSSDPELQAFMQTADGVVRWQPVRKGEAPDAALRRFAEQRAQPEEDFSYVGMVTGRGHYLIEVEDEALMVIRDGLEMVAEGGMAGPDSSAPLPESDESDESDEQFRGWSNGFDSRTRLTGNSIPDKVGRVSPSWGGQCSGELIGRRLVRTAAHCVVQFTSLGGSVATSVAFDYRRDANSVPVTTSTSTSSFYYGGSFIPSNCALTLGNDKSWGYRNNFDACTWADWAILILPTDWNGNTWHSWFGYKGLVGGNLGMALESGGYPGCGLAESPAACVNQAYYHDVSAPCSVTAWTNGTAKFRSGCDISPGNSGGPVWEAGTAYLIGHAQWQDCATCPSGSTNREAPNHYLGHDTWLFNFQNTLRSQYP